MKLRLAKKIIKRGWSKYRIQTRKEAWRVWYHWLIHKKTWKPRKWQVPALKDVWRWGVSPNHIIQMPTEDYNSMLPPADYMVERNIPTMRLLDRHARFLDSGFKKIEFTEK